MTNDQHKVDFFVNVSVETLRELIRHEPDTGKFFWLHRDVNWFKDGHFSAQTNAKKWNTRYAGKETCNVLDSKGYLQGTILYKIYRSHRVAWAMYYGSWPEFHIDHVDHNRINNRISNLRDVPHTTNGVNKTMLKNNTSGKCGVYWHRAMGKWHARINVDKVNIDLGFFSDKSEAIIAREVAENQYGYHKNHGAKRET